VIFKVAYHYQEEALIQLAALRHYMVCPRQCALIHIEQIWHENLFTAEGRILHDSAHSSKTEKRGNIKTVTGLRLRSLRLGLSGQADVVEFHREGKLWRPFPVEYKRGRPKKGLEDMVQLCAQAMCLEEMLAIEVPEGAMYYGKTRRRLPVIMSAELRNITKETSLAVHDLLEQAKTPPPLATERCRPCSLAEACQPAVQGRQASLYVEGLKAKR
jgi:CRISPR-associated exonuclease Cas4